MAELFTTLITLILVFLVSAFPLHLAVSLLGGRSSMLKAFLVAIFTGLALAVLSFLLAGVPYLGLILLLVLVWIYREMFRLKWIKAFLAWILQILFVFLLIWILGLIGLSVAVWGLFIP